MQLFYTPSIDHNTKEFVFAEEESKHITRVLRKKEGDLLQITNGNGGLFAAQILEANPKKCKAIITGYELSPPSHYNLHIAIAPTKNNDRLEWFLEKATEIGISRITPLLCDHSERKIIKPERLEKVLQAAMKQSLQTYLPQIHPLTPASEFITAAQADVKLIAHCAKGEKVALTESVKGKKELLILIGPEGDFSYEEIDLAQKHDFIPITLGQNRLRTETAGIVACTLVATANN